MSYCWGTPDDQVTIEINNVIFSVPTSSAAAIRRVRLPDDDRMIWIDAVCINQEDGVERAQQVSMKADIYSSSTGNMVYLGEGDPTTGMALRNIDSIMDEIVQETVNFKCLHETPFNVLDPDIVNFDPLTCEIDPIALTSFYNLPWFRSVHGQLACAVSREC